MRFKLADKTELDRAADYLAKLAGREAVVDIKRWNPKRSLSQNKFYHVILSYWGLQCGFTLEESKQFIKQQQPDLYQYRKDGGTFMRSSADLSTTDMAKSIDRFRQWSAEQGIDLPDADDKNFLEWCATQIENSGAYL